MTNRPPQTETERLGDRISRAGVLAEPEKKHHAMGEVAMEYAREVSCDLADALNDILEYSGGADSALDDPYVMERASAALAKYRQIAGRG